MSTILHASVQIPMVCYARSSWENVSIPSPSDFCLHCCKTASNKQTTKTVHTTLKRSMAYIYRSLALPMNREILYAFFFFPVLWCFKTARLFSKRKMLNTVDEYHSTCSDYFRHLKTLWIACSPNLHIEK